ncbi:TraX family protein [Lachnospiraceae bacterium 54-11]
MTTDHPVSVIYPNYPTGWRIILLHILGRLAAPIFWFFLVEGCCHTHDRKKYDLACFSFQSSGILHIILHSGFLLSRFRLRCLTRPA